MTRRIFSFSASFFATLDGARPQAAWVPEARALLVLGVCLLGVALTASPVGAQGANGLEQRLEEKVGRNSTAGSGNPGAAGAPAGSRRQMEGYGEEDYGEMESEGDMGYGEEDYGEMEMEMEMEMEGYGDMGYGEADYGNRGSRGSVGEVMQTYASSLTSVMSELDLAPLFAPAGPVEVQSGPYLAREAETAFKSGFAGVAVNLMFGHMVTEFPESIGAVEQVKWSPLLRRPVWHMRWGVSMAVRGGEGTTDPMPIREGATPSRRSFAGGGGGFGEGAYGEAGYGEESYGEEMMEEQSMEEEYSEMESGYGEMEDGYGDMDMEMGMGGSRPSNRSRQPAVPTRPKRDMLDQDAAEELDKTLGLVAAVLAESFGERYRNGDFGPLLTSVSEPATTAESSGPNAPRQAQRQANPQQGFGRSAPPPAPASSHSDELEELFNTVPPPQPMWKPGIVYLGQAPSNDVYGIAKEANLDLVLHFDVVLKPNRDGSVRNISRCRLLHVDAGKSLGVSKSFDSMEAANFAAAGRMGEREYVEEQLGNLLDIIDREATVTEFPKLTPEIVRSRVASLMASGQANSLRTLAEVRLYEAQGLLTPEEVELAFDIVGGVDGLVLLHGPLEQRLETVREWVARAQGAELEE